MTTSLLTADVNTQAEGRKSRFRMARMMYMYVYVYV
jgi:hypothetical protein